MTGQDPRPQATAPLNPGPLDQEPVPAGESEEALVEAIRAALEAERRAHRPWWRMTSREVAELVVRAAWGGESREAGESDLPDVECARCGGEHSPETACAGSRGGDEC